MRGSINLLRSSNGIGSTSIGRSSKHITCSAFSTAAGGGSGGGRGRGRGASGPSSINFVASSPGEADSIERSDELDKSFPPAGHGHGRGKPLPSSPFLPSYNSFVASNPTLQQPGIGRSRGGLPEPSSQSGFEQESQPKRPMFLKKDEETGTSSEVETVAPVPRQTIGEKNLPDSILNVLTGSGRGKPERKPVFEERSKEENRHLRPRPAVAGPDAAARRGNPKAEKGEIGSSARRPKLSREEAVKKAVGILSKDKDGREGERGERRGRRQRGVNSRESDDEGEDDNDDDAIYMGNDADGEKLANELGPTVMSELTEAFEEMSSEAFPDPIHDEYLEALDTNLQIELEPEYLLGDFEKNPDIHENPPMSLEEALEKMKPFLMAYEGIESQEEWDEAIKETMEKVPIMKEIVNHYCGPDRVTAKQQHGELERVANTLPASVPNSVKRFTDRAVRSLQSNPGWGFDRKCQFMDKFVAEVSKSYK